LGLRSPVPFLGVTTLDELRDDRGTQSARQPGLSGGHHAHGLGEIAGQVSVRNDDD